MSNAINWFELPANNFERAVKFYSEVLDAEIQRVEMPGVIMGFFPAAEQGVGGAVTYGDDKKPSAEGALVYLNGGDDLAQPLSRVEAAGGTVVLPKTSIGDNGFFAIFLDTEGNKVAFHSMN